MTTAADYAGLRDRDYLHIMLNLDSFEGFQPTARGLAEKFLAAARQRLAGTSLEAELRAFEYSPQAFEARLDTIYQGLVDDVARYEAKRSWTLRTREDVVEWLQQMAPFNQTDGAWLRKIAPVGPLDDVDALLFRIYIEELGNGDPRLNHPNVYTELLRSVDIELPGIRTRAYADNPALLDSAFTVPLFQLVVSEFSQDFRPELLGMTLYLEWSSVELRNMVRLHQHLGLDPHFYELHIGIDNAASGHGAMALRAVRLYLEGVRVAAGDEAMQAAWERVWTGYVAFATTGTLAQDVAARRRRPDGPAHRVADLIRDKAPKARLNHGSKQLGGRPINELFAEPAELLSALAESGLIVAGAPERSPFFGLLTSAGPMFGIFDAAEQDVWREWVRALAVVPTSHPPPPDDPPPDATPPDPAAAMMALVEALRERQRGTAAHTGTKLTESDPADAEATVEQSVSWWFEQPPRALLRALRAPANGWIEPGDPDASRLITELVRGANAMARAFAGPAGDGRTWADVATAWITAGCPLPGDELAAVRPLSLLSPEERVEDHPTGEIHGTGSVH